MASIAVLIGGQKFRWCDIRRDDDFIKILIQAETEFWQRCLDHLAPPVDDSVRTGETLKRLYATETGEVVSLGPDAIGWDDKLQAVKALIKDAEAQEQGLKNQFLNAIGAATVGTIPNGVLYTLKKQTTREHVVKESTFRVLRRKGAK
jgi:predicted phage-related endonuclease